MKKRNQLLFLSVPCGANILNFTLELLKKEKKKKSSLSQVNMQNRLFSRPVWQSADGAISGEPKENIFYYSYSYFYISYEFVQCDLWSLWILENNVKMKVHA